MLGVVSAPSLKTIGGELELYDNDRLSSVSFPALTAVYSRLYLGVYGSRAVQSIGSIDFTSLRTVGDNMELVAIGPVNHS